MFKLAFIYDKIYLSFNSDNMKNREGEDYIKKLFRDIGLQPSEIEAYLILLEFASLSVSLIAQKTHSKRTNVYNVMSRLIALGLVVESLKGKVKMYSAVDPEKVLFLLEQKKRNLESNIRGFQEVLPQLKSLQNPLVLKPKVAFYQGREGLKDLLNLALNSGDFIAYFDLETSYEIFPDVVDDFVRNINLVKPKIRELIVQSDAIEGYLKGIKNPLYQHKVFPSRVKFHSDQIVFGNFVAILSYREGFTGVLLESHDVAEAQRAVFELLWDTL